jgi:hypothetical protein
MPVASGYTGRAPLATGELIYFPENTIIANGDAPAAPKTRSWNPT